MEQYLNSCRVCLCNIKDGTEDAESKLNSSSVKIFFEKFTSFRILPDEPQTFCSYCYKELMELIGFYEKCERTQKVLDGMRISNEIDEKSDILSMKGYSQTIDFQLKEDVKKDFVGFLDVSSIKLEEKRRQNSSKKRKSSFSTSSRPKSSETKALKVICPYCATLVKSSYLENHIKYVHTEPRASYICDICNTNLSSKKSVLRHMTHVHLKIQKYKCKICKTDFPNETLRKAHLLQIHKVVPPKACPYCDYRAFTKAHITRHIQRHRGDRRFKCQTCSFAFVTLLQLQTHEAVHSDQRNFECDECRKRFKTKKNLSAHKKCHLEYEYECGVCKRAFLTNQMMRNHVTKNHPEFELPPPGTILNKEAVKRMKSIEAEILQYKPENNND